MDTCAVAFFVLTGIFVFGLVALGVLVIVKEETRRVEALGTKLAHQLGGRFFAGGLFGNPWIAFSVQGRPAHLRFSRGPDGPRTTSVEVDMRGLAPGTLKVYPEGSGWADGMARRFGPQDIVIGDREFDRQFVVKSNPESLARRLFSRERRAQVIASIRRLGRYGLPLIDLSKERLHIELALDSPQEATLLDLARTADEFVGNVMAVQPTADVHWLEQAPAASVGQCQVCGTDMRERVVYCASCKTPHHEECWQYTGECSTFACKETRYVLDGRLVKPPPRQQPPGDGRREERERDRRETGGGLRSRMSDLPGVEESLRRFERRQRERGGS